MSKNNTESKHIDKLVIYLFIGAFLLSAGVMAFRITKDASCAEVFFTYDSSNFRAGDAVSFNDKTEGAKEWSWEFGDSTEVDYIKDPTHFYKKAGVYEIKLMVNGFCEKSKEITITERVITRDSTKYPVFVLQKTIKVGETLTVKDETENADTWEWRFGDNSSVDSKEISAQYVYAEPGLKTVSLIVNGLDEYQMKKKIEVIPIGGEKSRITEIRKRQKRGWDIPDKAPSSEKEGVVQERNGGIEPLPVPLITERLFALQLVEIAKERVKPQALGKKYFCGELDMPIYVNTKKTTFLEFCEGIKGKNKLKDLEVELIRGKSPENCIQKMIIKYKRGWL
ncbi:MAG: hypothetical protein ACI9M9_002602 [Flavobacteriaceae bacterium]|jgi:hypothetical protein